MAAQSTVAAGSEFPSVVPCSAAACGAASVALGPFPEQPGGVPHDQRQEAVELSRGLVPGDLDGLDAGLAGLGFLRFR